MNASELRAGYADAVRVFPTFGRVTGRRIPADVYAARVWGGRP